MTGLAIRRYEPGDGPAVPNLHERALRDASDFAEDAPEPDLEDVPGQYLANGGEFIVGEVDGEIAAMGAYHPVCEWILADRFAFEDRTAELTRMRVDPDRQRRGYGAELYAELEDCARADGYDRFVLDVSEHNERARAFYDAQGFAYRERTTLETPIGSFRLAAYTKPLGK